MFLVTWSDAWPHFLIFAILYGVTPYAPTPSIRSLKHSTVFTITAKFSSRTGVRVDTISLPRQHSLMHYIDSIILFGSPNGLCSSITESKHIKAVKKPWRRSSRFDALPQMLLTNTRLDKLTAAKSVFTHRGMMQGSTLAYTILSLRGELPPPLPTIIEEERDDHGAVTGPRVMNSVKLAVCPGELACSTTPSHRC